MAKRQVMTEHIWRTLPPEAQDALITSGWHPGPPRSDGTGGTHVCRRIERQLDLTPAHVVITAAEARDVLALEALLDVAREALRSTRPFLGPASRTPTPSIGYRVDQALARLDAKRRDGGGDG
jgi:hypothetical protein